MTRPHARLGASSAHRWLNCPGSVRLSEGIVVPPSLYALEGTVAHALAEDCLTMNEQAANCIGWTFNDREIDEEMAEHVQLYLDTVRAAIEPGDTFLIEHQFNLDPLDPPEEMFGTADAIVYKPKQRHLRVFDLKYGWKVVEATGNPQGRYYALGAILSHNWQVDDVEITIVQPRAPHRDGPVRREVISAFDLLEWSAELLEGAERTQDPDAPLIAGDWCDFCPARGTCPALRSYALAVAQMDFMAEPLPAPPDPASLAPEQLGRLLFAADLVENWIKALKAHAYAELDAGREIPGWKLVPGRAVRKWRNELDAEVQLRLLELGDDEIFGRKLVSPARAEALLGNKRKGEIADLIEVNRGVKIAPETDARPAVAGNRSVDEFDCLEEN